MTKPIRLFLIFLAILVVYALIINYSFFDPNQHLRILTIQDFIHSYPQLYYFLKNLSLSHLSIAHWNQLAAAGSPTVLEFNNYYFPAYLLKIVFKIRHNFISLIDWQNFILAHYLVGGTGMYLFLRRYVRGWTAAVFGSIFFLSSGLMHAVVWPSYIFPIALIPWIFYLTVQFLGKNRFVFLAITAFLLFEQLAVCPQMFMYTVIALTGFILSFKEKEWLFKIKTIISIFGLAILFSAVTLLPLVEYTPYAVRQNFISTDMLNFFSTKASDLFQLLVYSPGWMYTYLYLGGVSLFLLISLFANKKAPVDFKILLLAVTILFISMNSSLIAPIIRLVPGLGLMRWHSRANELVIFLLVILLAKGLAYLTIVLKRDLTILGSLSVLAVLIYYLRPERTPANLEQLGYTLFFLGLAAVTVYTASHKIINPKVTVLIVGLLIVFDLGRVHLLERSRYTVPYPVDNNGRIQKNLWYLIPPSIIGDQGFRTPFDGFEKTDSSNYFLMNQTFSGGYYSAAGSEQSPAVLASYDTYLKAATINPNLMKLANISQGNGFLPRAFISECYRTETNDLALIDKMSNPQFIGDDFIYLSQKPSDSAGRELKDGKNCDSEITPIKADQSNDKIVFAPINLNQPAFLFISDNYYPGWNAYINGEKKEIIRADYTFKAVSLSSGENKVEFRFESKSIKIGGMISLATGLSSIAVIMVGFIRRRKRRTTIVRK